MKQSRCDNQQEKKEQVKGDKVCEDSWTVLHETVMKNLYLGAI